MDAFLTDISALQLWFTDQPVIRSAKPLMHVPTFADASVTRAELPWTELDALGLRRPYHLAVHDPTRRRSSRNIICHVFRNPPPNSFVRISHSVYAEAPIPTLIKAASLLPTGALMRLMYQLLGTYQLKQGEIIGRKPLATITELASYLRRAYRINGLEPVRALLPYAIQHIASPEEARLAALLFLPARHGGQGFPLAEANARIELNGTETGVRFADLLWRLWRLILEYDSDRFHTGAEKIGQDSARRTQLQAAGYQVVTMTRHQLHDPAAFRDVVRTLRRFMGDAAPCANELPPRAFTQPELELRRELYGFDIERALGL